MITSPRTTDTASLKPLIVGAVALAGYSLLTRSLIALIGGIVVAIAIRALRGPLDKMLGPIVPLRNRLPRGLRAILAWTAPLLISFWIAQSPSFYRMSDPMLVIGMMFL